MLDLLLSTLVLFHYLHGAVLIGRMGDGHFPAREDACRALVALLRQDEAVWLLPLVEYSLQHPDPEVAHRARLVREEFFNVWPSAAERMPWLDMLPESLDGRQSLLNHYLPRAQAMLGPSGSPDWLDYRLATAFWVHDRLRAGVARSQVVRLLDEMAVNEQRYLARR